MARAASTKKKGNVPRPDGELRQSQMITTYGPGSLVDLVNDAILVPGLEYWSYKGASGYEVHEPRLADNLRQRGIKLSTVGPFRSPPVCADEDPHRGCGIGAVEFPSWFLCPQRDCERLIHKRDTEYKGARRRHRCQGATKPSNLVPVRFVTACPNGHLDDFPWEWFVHAKGTRCGTPELRLTDKGSGDLTDVVLHCQSCGAKRSMAEAKVGRALPSCRGKRPWLGAYVGDPSVEEECDDPDGQRLLLRTASNGYFSQVESALSIPRTSKLAPSVLEFLEAHHDRDLRTIESGAEVAMARKFIAVLKDGPVAIAKLSDAELWHALATFRAEKSEEAGTAHVRETEYSTITGAPVEKGNHMYAQYGEQQDFYAERPAPGTWKLPEGIRDLVLLKRLREVRVLTGFTRLESESQNIYGEFDVGSRRAELGAASDWLPASEIRGEGFFVELDFDALEAWEKRPAVVAREAELKQGFLSRFPNAAKAGIDFQGARFYLLHTLAHLLITQVSLDCGYAASAIRERIYCSPKNDHDAMPMAGVLLSTGSSGSEGTLGGLVEQGRKIDYHLTEALRRAKLCSHDPVCGRQHPTQGLPGRALLGSACHGCLFIAECSCERSNHYLDRALVVPTLGVPNAEDVAYFRTPAGMSV